MLGILLCGECPSPRDNRGNLVPGKELAGGTAFKGPYGLVYAANITSHPSAGIGTYSNDDLKRILREGKNRAGRDLWVMPWSVTKNLTDADLDALIAALREVPSSVTRGRPRASRSSRRSDSSATTRLTGGRTSR
jgi:hypothetical protein